MKIIYRADNSGSTLITSIYSIFRKRLILNTSLRRIIVSWEKARAIGLEGASSRTLDP